MKLNKVSAILLCAMFVTFPLLLNAADGVSADPQFEQRKKDPLQVQQEKQMEEARNKQRHQEIKQDTEKLLELATELKQYVDRTNENVLSLDVVKKAEEIEKLAKSVKSKMKDSLK